MARRTHAREFLSTDSVFDEGIVNGALKQVGMLSFTGEKFGKLSIEKKQRVHIALALVQEPKWLIIDCLSQPQNVSFQVEMLGVAVRLGLTTLVPFQDLALAAAYCQRIYVIDKGRIVAVGPPHKPSLRSASAQTFVCAPRLLSTR
jgi:iron complex transport system ATP-binding protein